MQIRAELDRILQEPDITKSFRGKFQGGWRESLLTVVRRSDNKKVMAFMEETWKRLVSHLNDNNNFNRI